MTVEYLESIKEKYLSEVERRKVIIVQHNEGFLGESKSYMLYRANVIEIVKSIFNEFVGQISTENQK